MGLRPNLLAALSAGGSGYSPKAVHFNIGVSLQRMLPFAAGPSSTGRFSTSLWLNSTASGSEVAADVIPIVTLPGSNLMLGVSFTSDATPVLNQVYDSVNSRLSYAYSVQNVFPITSWTNLAISYDAAEDDPLKVIQTIVNRVPLELNVGGNYSGPITIDLSGNVETSFSVGSSSFAGNGVFDAADVQIWVDQAIDWSNPSNLNAVVSPAGKPVNPAVAALAFGQQSMLFSGGADTFGNNAGSYGAFDLVGGSLITVNGPG